MKFTLRGTVTAVLNDRIRPRIACAGSGPTATEPSPPALETAIARSGGVPTNAIGACAIGCRTPYSRVNLVSICFKAVPFGRFGRRRASFPSALPESRGRLAPRHFTCSSQSALKSPLGWRGRGIDGETGPARCPGPTTLRVRFGRSRTRGSPNAGRPRGPMASRREPRVPRLPVGTAAEVPGADRRGGGLGGCAPGLRPGRDRPALLGLLRDAGRLEGAPVHRDRPPDGGPAGSDRRVHGQAGPADAGDLPPRPLPPPGPGERVQAGGRPAGHDGARLRPEGPGQDRPVHPRPPAVDGHAGVGPPRRARRPHLEPPSVPRSTHRRHSRPERRPRPTTRRDPMM